MKALLERLNSLPTPVKVAGVVVLGIGLFAAGLLMRSGIWILLTVLLLFALLLGGFWLWIVIQRRRQQKQFTQAVQQQGAAAPREISAPTKRAALDDLKRRFDQGLQQYNSRGKDLYRLPWYLIVGEPGSGKTEAIRHCDVGFPPGMHEEMQGAGGTVNMNWWFTNHGVMLDTAGRLMFEEVAAGSTSEWQEFLKMLRKARPNCPINGLLLMIPVDSLIRDSADEIHRKAGRIAQQFDLVQRALDIRFPVYVMATKCDLLIGFREFFDKITDPQLQHQMLGWANLEPLDAPFRPDQVDQHLQSVAAKLHRRRLALLRDPVPEDPNVRRADETAALFAFPDSLTKTIAPRLRRYLETIFVAGEWSAKPLFLRGIFFSSSLREGSALDQELAQALGVTVSDLPSGRVWERDRAFFLRDLFMEKMFREKGLVTRAANTDRMLRRRRIILISAGATALVLWLLVAWLGMRQLRVSVRDQSAYWKTAVKPAPIVVAASDRPGESLYQGETEINLEGAVGHQPLVDFQTRLAELAKRPLKTSWIYRPVFWIVPVHGLDRKHAQRVVFERDVLAPVVDATRQKMRQTPTKISAELRTAQAGALLALVQIESELLNRQEGRKRGVLEKTEDAQRFLEPMLAYVAGVKTDTNLVATMAWTYSKDGDGKGEWPPSWLSAGAVLVENEAIHSGLDQITGEAFGLPLGGRPESPALSVDQLKQVWESMRILEAELATAATTPALAGRHDQALKRYADRVRSFAAVARALLDNHDAPISCRVGLEERQERSTVNAFRTIEVISDKGKATVDTSRGQYQELAALPVDRGLKVQMYRYKSDEAPVSKRDCPAWGPIALLARGREGAKRSADGKTWTIPFPVTDDAGAGRILLRIEFDRALPELSQWLAP